MVLPSSCTVNDIAQVEHIKSNYSNACAIITVKNSEWIILILKWKWRFMLKGIIIMSSSEKSYAPTAFGEASIKMPGAL